LLPTFLLSIFFMLSFLLHFPHYFTLSFLPLSLTFLFPAHTHFFT
jgi:hypothetical protein